jgi:hypothetical protein
VTRAQLRASLALWRRRLTYRQRKVDYYRGKAMVKHGSRIVVTAEEAQAIHKWEGLRDEAKAMVSRRTRQLSRRPAFVTARELGLTFQYVFGAKGPVVNMAGHYTAGHRVANRAALMVEMRVDHAYHKSKGWGGGSYEAMVADDGTIGFLNPMDRKSAAVALHNTGMVNICVPGTTGDRMTAACRESVRWLLDNWHDHPAIPKAHRLPRSARGLTKRIHREWPDQSTACCGDMKADYEAIW